MPPKGSTPKPIKCICYKLEIADWSKEMDTSDIVKSLETLMYFNVYFSHKQFIIAGHPGKGEARIKFDDVKRVKVLDTTTDRQMILLELNKPPALIDLTGSRYLEMAKKFRIYRITIPTDNMKNVVTRLREFDPRWEELFDAGMPDDIANARETATFEEIGVTVESTTTVPPPGEAPKKKRKAKKDANEDTSAKPRTDSTQ